jgi:hypothetical protein
LKMTGPPVHSIFSLWLSQGALLRSDWPIVNDRPNGATHDRHIGSTI